MGMAFIIHTIDRDIMEHHYRNKFISEQEMPIKPDQNKFAKLVELEIKMTAIFFIIFWFLNTRNKNVMLLARLKYNPKHLSELSERMECPGKMTPVTLGRGIERLALYLYEKQEELLDGMTMIKLNPSSFEKHFVSQFKGFQKLKHLNHGVKFYGFGAPHQVNYYFKSYEYPLFVPPHHSGLGQHTPTGDSILVCMLLNSNRKTLRKLKRGSGKDLLVENLKPLIRYNETYRSLKASHIVNIIKSFQNLKWSFVEFIVEKFTKTSLEKALAESAFILTSQRILEEQDWQNIKENFS